jgi:hypothetical protein
MHTMSALLVDIGVLNRDPPIYYASQVPRITGVHNHTQLFFFFLGGQDLAMLHRLALKLLSSEILPPQTPEWLGI